MTKPIVASRNFVSAPKNCSQSNVGDIFIPISVFEENMKTYRLAHSYSDTKVKV